jgi:long-subunit fatty acid transport protein
MITQLDALLAFIGGSVAYGGENWGIGTTLQLATLPQLSYRMVVDGTGDPELNPNLSAFDIEAEVSVSDPAAFTALVGAWFRPTPSFEIALSGRVLPVRFDATGNVNIHNTPNDVVFDESMLTVKNNSAALSLTLPQTARLGLRYRGLDETGQQERYDLEFALVYERWSVMDEIEVDLKGKVVVLGNSDLTDVTLPKMWRDTLSARLGGSYRVNDKLKFSAGGFYEQGATPRQYAHLDFPSFDRLGLAGGVSYQLIPQLELVVGYLHIFETEVKVSEQEGKVFQQRPIAPCDDAGCGSNEAGEAYSGVPANAGTHRVRLQSFTLGLNASF